MVALSMAILVLVMDPLVLAVPTESFRLLLLCAQVTVYRPLAEHGL